MGPKTSTWSREGVDLVYLKEEAYSSSADLLRDLRSQTKAPKSAQKSSKKKNAPKSSETVKKAIVRRRNDGPDIGALLSSVLAASPSSIDHHLGMMMRMRGLGDHLLGSFKSSSWGPSFARILDPWPDNWTAYEELRSRSNIGSLIEIITFFSLAMAASSSPHSELLGASALPAIPITTAKKEAILDYRVLISCTYATNSLTVVSRSKGSAGTSLTSC
ncbi:hypothetical protein BT69DRAFT_137931 [Atractiella rhizophila]|nr:hypothetical protein BT69DRAFT_137931 [Atractiella rhizophila]